MSALIDISDSVAAQLNEHVFRLEFTAERAYADIDEEIAHEGLAVEVVPVERVPTELETRGSVHYLCSADVVVRQKLAVGEDGRVVSGDVDNLVALVEEIHEWLIARELANEATWDSTVVIAAVVHRHLREWNQFTGIIRVTYSLTKCLQRSAESS